MSISTVGQEQAIATPSVTSRGDRDFDLLQRIARKDKRALEELYLRYYRRLFQFVFRLVHRQEITEEIVNDVMFIVWQQAGSFKGQSRPSTWLIGIAYRKSLKALRSLKRLRELGIGDEADFATVPDSSWAADPEASFADAELTEQLKRGIDLLSVEHRSVVELTALGYSYAEIAQIVECPINTVKTRMFHARRRLMQLLSEMRDQTTIDTNGEPT